MLAYLIGNISGLFGMWIGNVTGLIWKENREFSAAMIATIVLFPVKRLNNLCGFFWPSGRALMSVLLRALPSSHYRPASSGALRTQRPSAAVMGALHNGNSPSWQGVRGGPSKRTPDSLLTPE